MVAAETAVVSAIDEVVEDVEVVAVVEFGNSRCGSCCNE